MTFHGNLTAMEIDHCLDQLVATPHIGDIRLHRNAIHTAFTCGTDAARATGKWPEYARYEALAHQGHLTDI